MMACQAVYSGAAFLSSSLGYIDCQAQSLGTFGFQELSMPHSTGATVLLGLLTLFVAVFGYRLILGYPIDGRDVATTVLKIGIVLTLATSWSAYRTVLYNVVLYGPAEIAGQITGASGLASNFGLVARLENADAGIVALTLVGTGREGEQPATTLTEVAPGVVAPQVTPEAARNKAAFDAVAVDDKFGLGFSRVAYLTGTLAPLAVLRIGAGLLLALGPLVGGLLLFSGTRGLFFGWLRSLAAVALGSLAIIVSLSVELALIEPWLSDVLARRAADGIAPAAPTELVVITVSFAVLSLGLLTLFGRLAFNPGGAIAFVRARGNPSRTTESRTFTPPAAVTPPTPPSRAAQVAERLTTIHRGERRNGADQPAIGFPSLAGGPPPSGGRAAGEGPSTAGLVPAHVPLGSSYRRSMRRTSQVTSIRDRRN